MRSLIMFALLAVSGIAWSAGEDFTYKGVKVGDSVEVVREKLPAYECRGSLCDYSMSLCVRRQSREACDASASFGGAWIKSGTIRLHDGKVISMLMQFTQPLVAAAADSATQAYGAPSREETRDLQTRAGAKVSSWHKAWEREGQTLEITQRLGDIETGVAFVTSAEGRAILEQERKARATKGAKDF